MYDFEVLTAYWDGQKVASEVPVHTDPKEWVEGFRERLLKTPVLHADVVSGNYHREFKGRLIGGSAAWALWSDAQGPRCVVTIVSGASDQADDQVVRICEDMPGLPFPRDRYKFLWVSMLRPGIVAMHTSRASFEDQLINAGSIGLAMAVYKIAGVKGRRTPPLGSPQLEQRAAGKPFYHLVVTRDGLIDGAMHMTYEQIVDVRDVPDLVAAFNQRFADQDSPERFEAMVKLRIFEGLSLAWQAFGPTSGVAHLAYDAQHISETLLLLTGLDPAADAAAITAYEMTVTKGRMGPNWDKTFDQIRRGPRPLLVSFGAPEIGLADLPVNLVEWSLAAAYFRRTQVV